jgi:hypothetical protein
MLEWVIRKGFFEEGMFELTFDISHMCSWAVCPRQRKQQVPRLQMELSRAGWRTQQGWGCRSVVEHLSTMSEVLGSMPSIEKENKKIRECT